MGSFAGASLFHYYGGGSSNFSIDPGSTQLLDNSAGSSNPNQSTPTSTTQNTPPPPTTPAKKSGQFADGTYMGEIADAYYGNVEVSAVISNGKLADIKILDYPSDRSTSRFINSHALPMLKSEAIQAQSANVDTISGATDTSAAFRQSLGSALSQAKNS